MITALKTQLDELATKIWEEEFQCNKKGRCILPHERKRSRDSENNRVEDMLQIILQEISEKIECWKKW